MRRQIAKQLISEYVRVLLEDDAGDIMMAGAEMMPWGVHYFSDDALYKAFVKPFTDVISTAAGQGKELARKAQTVVASTFEAIATILIPAFNSDYTKIFEKEAKDIEKIRSEYADVYKSTWDALSTEDVLFAAFAYAPGPFLAGTIAKKAPSAAAKLASILSGGSLDNILSKYTKGGGGGHKSSTVGPSPSSFFEGKKFIAEAGEEQQKPKQTLSGILSNKKVQQIFNSNAEAQRMSEEMKKTVHTSLNTIYDRAKAVNSAKNLNDLQNVVKKKFPEVEKLKEIPQEQRAAAESQLADTIKKSVKKFYADNLKKQADEAIKAGISKDHPYVNDLLKTVNSINSL